MSLIRDLREDEVPTAGIVQIVLGRLVCALLGCDLIGVVSARRYEVHCQRCGQIHFEGELPDHKWRTQWGKRLVTQYIREQGQRTVKIIQAYARTDQTAG